MSKISFRITATGIVGLDDVVTTLQAIDAAGLNVSIVPYTVTDVPPAPNGGVFTPGRTRSSPRKGNPRGKPFSDANPSKQPSAKSPSWNTGLKFLKTFRVGHVFSVQEAKDFFGKNGFSRETATPVITFLRRAGKVKSVDWGRYKKL